MAALFSKLGHVWIAPLAIYSTGSLLCGWFYARRERLWNEHLKYDLLQASATGDVARLKKVLNQLHLHMLDRPVFEDNDPYSALHSAAYNGHAEAADLLLDYRQSLIENTTTNYKRTPFMFAAEGGKVATMTSLLNRGANFDAVSSIENHGSSAIHFAARFGGVKAVEFLLDHPQGGRRLLELPNHHKRTPFMSAAEGGQVETMKLLLNRGANFNAKSSVESDQGNSAIHLAALGGSAKSVEWLLDHPNGGRRLLELCSACGRTPFLKAVEGGNVETMTILLNRGANFNAVSSVKIDHGMSAIHLAVLSGRTKSVEFLLDHPRGNRKQLELIDGALGYTPFLIAAEGSNVETMTLLLNRGANFDAVTSVQQDQGKSAIHVAARVGAVKSLQFLLDHPRGGRRLLELSDAVGYTPLLCAARYDQIESMALLLDQGANFDAVTSVQQDLGNSAIHVAALYGGVKSVEFLLDHPRGGQRLVNCRNATNLTPLILACINTYDEAVIRLLISRGADVTARDNNGYTAETYLRKFCKDERKKARLLSILYKADSK